MISLFWMSTKLSDIVGGHLFVVKQAMENHVRLLSGKNEGFLISEESWYESEGMFDFI